MLIALAHQLLQDIQSLIANLPPVVLETQGLTQALEALTNQTIRTYGVQIRLTLAPLSERLPHPLELALFRMAQDAIEQAINQSRASRLAIRLTKQAEQLSLSLRHNGLAHSQTPLQPITGQRLAQLGGIVKTGSGAGGEFEISVTFTLKPPPHLTPREMAVLQLLAEGLSNKEIARRLSVTPRTVNFHLDNIYSKLAVHSRTEAVICAF